MCCDSDNVLCIDTTFNLCSSWVTVCCYNNDRLRTNEGKHAIFLGPAIIHFEKDVFLFSRFASEMLTHQPAISNLKTIGTDLEKAIFNKFLSQIKDLKLLLCVFHLQQNDKRRLTELRFNGGSQAICTILADIYGRLYSTMIEYGLAYSKDANDLATRLESLRESWENLCPEFYKWVVSMRQAIFQNSVIECARKNTNVHGLFYNNSIECQHYLEKKEQSFRKGTVEDVIKTFKSLVERQQDEEVRAIYRSGPYRLSDRYKKFEVDSVKWHSMYPKARMKHPERFWRYFGRL